MKVPQKLFAVALVVGALSAVCTAEPTTPLYGGKWTVISDAILAALQKDHPKSNDKFTTMTAGISVDRTSGQVYLLANNIGICKSVDQGNSFALVSGSAVTGRFETGWGLNIDPAGGRLMCFTIYGASAYSGDAGKTWQRSQTSHLDYGAVDWSDTAKAVLAIGHESGGKLLYSSNAGAEWKNLGSGYTAAGLCDASTLMTSAKAGGLLRSTDRGQTWTKVSDEKLAAPVMVLFNGTAYWLGENGLLISKDTGKTWSIAASLPKGAALGPMFGKDESHVVVACPDGLYESRDAGKSWRLAVPPAPEIKVLKLGQWATYGWDPIHNIFYASQMMKPAYRFIATTQ